MRLTEEQRAAVERRDGPLLLHAGAGSGKTRVLVERFVRAVLDDGVPVDRILAITFTEKAAGELRSRIRRRLIDLGERERAREAEGAWVSTIHGFCSRLLRTHPLAAGIDPEYRVLDDAEAARLALDAFDRALEDFLIRAGSDERLDLVASYTPDKLERMVSAVHSRLRSQGQSRPRLPEIDPPRLGGERERLDAALRGAGAVLAAAGDGTTVERARERICSCTAALAELDPGAYGDATRFTELAVKRGNARALKVPELDELEEAHGAWVSACAARKAHADYVLLRRLLELHANRYAELKDARSALDFEDLELRARDLLSGAPALRAALRARFTHVMVDEFQDTNPLQNELLDLVSDGNLFAVGDERQSIYGFRNADVGVFRARRAVAEERGFAARLATSFRAAPEVIDALNATFAGVWGEEYMPLAIPPGAERDRAGEPPRVELLLVDKSRDRWVERLGEGAFGESMGDRPPWRAAEARLLALRIDTLIRSGRCRPGDVAVLLRAAPDMPAYERALSDRGLPTYAAGGGGYWEQQQIADLRAYLAALANPLDELALVNVLASPLAGASLDALALVRRRARALRRDPWWALDEAFGGDGSGGLAGALPVRDRARVGAFVERFRAERAAAPRLSLETLIDRAVTAFGYDRAILSLPHGARRMANVRKLMRLAREFEADAGRDLRRFIDFVDERELLRGREGEAPLEGEGLDAVRLMTIHAAKGLEFPVVCVADLGRDGRGDDGALQVSTDGRVGLQVASLGGGSHSALAMDAIKAEKEAEAEEEERRIFYVAMTRAERHLIVSGAADTARWPQPRALGTPMDWVWRSLAPGARELWEEGGAEVDDVRDGGRVRVRCVLLSPETVDEVLPAAERTPGAAAGAAAAAPDPAPASDPPAFAPISAGPALPVARLSYSALESYKRCGYRFYVERVAGMRRREPAAAERPLADDAGDQLALSPADVPPADAPTPVVRGIVVHELLERLDFRRPAVPPAAAVADRLRGHGAPAGDAAVADVRALVEGFVRSPLCRRVSAARRVRTELQFAFALEPPGLGGQSLLIDGVLDVHAVEDGGSLVVDYKSDALQGRDPARVVAEKYGAQRVVYALAALRAGAEAVEVAYLFLERPDAPVAERYGPADGPALERELLELAGGIVSRRFVPTGSPHRELCHDCPARPALCSWGPERTMADRPEGETFGGPEPVDLRARVA